MLAMLKKTGKIIWIVLGGFILLWIGYFIYKAHTANSPGLTLLAAFFLMMGLALLGIFILITVLGKVTLFLSKKRKR